MHMAVGFDGYRSHMELRGLTIGPMRPVHAPQLRAIVAAAFSGEPFTEGMYGPSRLERYRRLLDDYRSFPGPQYDVVVAAFDDVVVGFASMERPGACSLCDGEQPALGPDSDTAERIEHEFERRCREAHATAHLPTGHARITAVATEPFVAGEGVGQLVVSSVLEHAWALGAPGIALECLTSRRAFYARVGFVDAVEFDDPGGPGLSSLLMVAERPG
jgi:GNAT superfamily N-acetyltransferase